MDKKELLDTLEAILADVRTDYNDDKVSAMLEVINLINDNYYRLKGEIKLTTKQKELMLSLFKILGDIDKEAIEDMDFSYFLADTLNEYINCSLDELAVHIFVKTIEEK